MTQSKWRCAASLQLALTMVATIGLTLVAMITAGCSEEIQGGG